ncbi:UBC-like protein, partial [Caulochytrium protostelioides]
MSAIFAKRLQRELRELQASPPVGIAVETVNDSLKQWSIRIDGPEETLYAGEQFHLQFRFPEAYPLESPEVIFLDPVPVHPHVYSNGHICL